jgi:hypothetical protein
MKMAEALVAPGDDSMRAEAVRFAQGLGSMEEKLADDQQDEAYQAEFQRAALDAFIMHMDDDEYSKRDYMMFKRIIEMLDGEGAVGDLLHSMTILISNKETSSG